MAVSRLFLPVSVQKLSRSTPKRSLSGLATRVLEREAGCLRSVHATADDVYSVTVRVKAATASPRGAV